MAAKDTEQILDTEADHELVSCEVCLTSVPKSDSKVVEADEYVAYFCGLECYDKWVKPEPDKK